MHSNQPFITLEGYGSHTVLDRVVQPPLQVLVHSDAARIQLNPTVPVGHRLGELCRHFLPRPAVDVPALGTLGGVHRVPGHPAAVLALPYRPLAVASLLAHPSVPPLWLMS